MNQLVLRLIDKALPRRHWSPLPGGVPLAPLQPLQPCLEKVTECLVAVGAAVSVLLAGNERGHVQQQLQESDRAMVALVEARCAALDLGQPPLDCRASGPAAKLSHLD